MPLAEDLADPDMCGHLCPGLAPGVAGAFGAGVADVAEVADDVCGERAAGVEVVEALAMVSPNASVAPRAAPPAAVPRSGLVILTRSPFCFLPPGPPARGGPVLRLAVVGQPDLTGRCAVFLSQR